MRYKLYEYQEIAVSKLVSNSEKLFNSDKKNKYILLKAITGAGKTVISSSYIEEMFKEYSNIAFVWISVGKGGLHIQSMNSLKEKLPSYVSVKLADEALRSDCLKHNEVLVLNWEGLNTTKIDEITGEAYFDNINMREGEQRNLQELWRKTIENGTKLVLIIDESHNTAKSKTSRDIIDLINPNFVLEITATPSKERIPDGDDEADNKAFYVKVPTKDVIKSGVIKKGIILNDIAVQEKNYESSIDLMIKQSIDKRNELLEAYKAEGKEINPLCIIQLPDGKDGESLKKDILSILQDKGFSISNNKVAVWLSNEKINLEYITNNNSKVDFLVFKQAVATGWDCPRASILVKLRDTKSTIFDLQTIGRILRMPERKHYMNESLNNGYVYTNSEYTINTGDYDQVLPIRQILKKEFKEEILNLEFNSQKVINSRETVDMKTVEKSFVGKMEKEKLNLNLEELALNIKTAQADIINFDLSAKEDVKFLVKKEQLYKLTSKDINFEFEKFIKSLSDVYYPYANLTNLIKRYFGSIKELDGDYLNQKKAVLLNRNIISQYFKEIKADYKNTIPTYIETVKFSFKEDRYTAEKETINYEKCAYYKHFAPKQYTEKAFEEYLETLDNVTYWIKNVDSGDGLSIVYEYEKVKHEFYPDYIVRFKDGSIGLYEVKHKNDKEKETITRAKMEKLKDYALEYGYKCGKIECEKLAGNKETTVCLTTLPRELK